MWGTAVNLLVPDTQQHALPEMSIGTAGDPGSVTIIGGSLCRFWSHADLGFPVIPVGGYVGGTGFGVTSNALDLRGCFYFTLVAYRAKMGVPFLVAEQPYLYLFCGTTAGIYEGIGVFGLSSIPCPCALAMAAAVPGGGDYIFSMPFNFGGLNGAGPYPPMAVTGNTKIVIHNLANEGANVAYTWELWGQG